MLVEIPKRIYVWSWISLVVAIGYFFALLVYGLLEGINFIAVILALFLFFCTIFLWLYPLVWIVRNFNDKVSSRRNK